MKRFTSLFMLLFAFLMTLPYSAYAADTAVTYSDAAHTFIFEPGKQTAPSDLFDNFKHLMPGDCLTQTISIRNQSDSDKNVTLYLRSTGAQPGSDAFLSQLHLSVQQNGTTELYSAPANQTAGLTDWVCLGTLAPGAATELNLTLSMPLEISDSFQSAVGSLNWQFRAEELPLNPSSPKTGDTAPIALYAHLGLFAILGLVYFLRSDRRTDASIHSN